MSLISKYINNISGFQFFQLFKYGTLFLIGILFAKSYLTTTEIGIYETLIFISGSVSFFWVAGIIQSFLPLYNNSKTFGRTENKKSPEIFNVAIIFIIFSLLAALFVYLLNNYIAQVLIDKNKIPYLKYLIIYILLNNPTLLIEYIYMVRNKVKLIITYGVITFIIQLFLVGCPPLLGYGIEISLQGLIIVSFLRLIWLAVLLFRYSKPSLSLGFIKEHLSSGIPLLASVFLSGSAQYIDGLIVTAKYDESVFAVFRYGARELPFTMLLANAFSLSILPSFSKHENFQKNLKTIKKHSLRLMHLLFPLTILLLLTSHWFYPLVFNENFSESSRIFNVYLLLIISRLIFPQIILVGLKKNRFILIATTIELIINVTLSLIFIKYFGMTGVAIATVIAFIAERYILIFINSKILKVKLSQYTATGWHWFYSSITIITYIIAEYENWKSLLS